jgi:endonuclease/exonuclease/phosphatase family metal-dependent hydrolase
LSLLGDVNLDTARWGGKRYGQRCLLLAHDNAIAEANMRYLTTGVTYRSHSLHKREDGEARGKEFVLNHVCVTKDLEATMTVLTDSTTDHFPVVAAIKVNRVTPTKKTIKRETSKPWRGRLSSTRWSSVRGRTYTGSGTG